MLSIRRVALLSVSMLGLVSMGAGSRTSEPPVDEGAVEATLASLGSGVSRLETEHFVILCDGSASWARSTATLLESTHDRFERLMRHLGQPMAPARSKLQCVLIRDHGRFEAFARGQDGVEAGWMGGYYATHTNRIVFYDTMTSPEFVEASSRLEELDEQARRARERAAGARRDNNKAAAEVYRTLAVRAEEAGESQRRRLADQATNAGAAKTTHEAAHLLSFNAGLQVRSRQYPFWLSEGLASCFEAATEDDARRGLFGPDRENPVRQREFARALAVSELAPLEAFVEMNTPNAADSDGARVLYAQAHALFRWLYRYERESLGLFFADIAREPPGTIAARRQGELFRSRFGDAARLERRWLREAGAEAQRIAEASEE